MSTVPRFADRADLARVLKCHERTISRALGETSFSRKCRRTDFRALCSAFKANPEVLAAALRGEDELLSTKEIAERWEMDRREVEYLQTRLSPLLPAVARVGQQLRFSRNHVLGTPTQGGAA